MEMCEPIAETTVNGTKRWPLSAGIRVETGDPADLPRREAVEQILVAPESCQGLVVREDGNRPGFFDFQYDGWLYFVYVYPSRRRALLLKAWHMR